MSLRRGPPPLGFGPGLLLMSRVLKTFAVLAACVALGVPACHGTISGGPPASSNQGLGGLTPSPQPGAGGAGGGASFSSGVICAGGHDAPVVPLRRFTRLEYANAARDLLGGSAVAPDDIPADETVGPFASNTVTSVTDLSTEQYLESAERLAAAAVATPAAVDTLVACDRAAMGDAVCASGFVDRFGGRAFRHPLAADEKARYVGLFTTAAAGGAFSDGIRVVVEAMLQSPSFLYHLELDATPVAAGTLVALDSYQLAARLAFFLWASVPDDALMTAAAGGGLADPTALRAQVTRMLA